MNKILHILIIAFSCAAFISCEKGGDEQLSKTYSVVGKVEKGPFVQGSAISIQPLGDKMQSLGISYSTTISRNDGSFAFGEEKFSSPYAELVSDGYFFNEVKGELSAGTLRLRAIVDLSDGAAINVNILTHLKYSRIKNLMSNGATFSQANSQAQKELLSIFGLQEYDMGDAAEYSIVSGTDQSAALIAISVLLLGDRSEAEFTEYLAVLSEEFGRDGKFSDSSMQKIEEDKEEIYEKLNDIEENIISRYEELGQQVEVKELSGFFDWNGDGEVGNETLMEGESIKLEPSTINVPNEGGTFTVKIESPIKLYLKPQMGDEPLYAQPDNNISIDQFFYGLYDGNFDALLADKEVDYEAELSAGALSITVSKLQSKTDKVKIVPLYDYVGNTVAEVKIEQEGKDEPINITETPLLGKDAQMAVGGMAATIAEGLRDYNIIEQIYNYNRYTNNLKSYITPNSGYVSNAWAKMYKANSQLLSLKKADEERLNVYADYCNVFSALYYSNLVYGWGAVPYVTNYDILTQVGGIPAERPENILNDLKNNLLKAIDNLEEKKNESMKDVNGFFFVSKDVARVLLANIYMYENNYNEALPLLQKVVSNNFYALDASTNFAPDDDVNVEAASVAKSNSIKESTEVIFALINESAGTRAQTSFVIKGASGLPYITLSDVYLSLAECHCKLGDDGAAKQYIDEVVGAKSLTISENDVLMQIKEIREQILLYSGTYFAFLKRAGIATEVCGIEDYQLLFPIPNDELYTNNMLTQNEGY